MIKINKIIDNLNIHYIKKGNGKSILILPGWGTTIDTYEYMINNISTYSTVYCLDMPGFGSSTEPDVAWNLDEYIDFIIKFIESENITKLDIIGHSNGGRIAIKMMSRSNLPFAINKIILIGSAGIVHPLKTTQKIKVNVYKIGKKFLNFPLIHKIFPNALNKLQSKFGSEDYKNASNILRQSMVKLINEDLKKYLSNINVPTLLIWGEKDDATPIEDAYIMEKLIPDAGVVKVKNASHYVFLEAPDYVNKIIYTFLKEDN